MSSLRETRHELRLIDVDRRRSRRRLGCFASQGRDPGSCYSVAVELAEQMDDCRLRVVSKTPLGRIGVAEIAANEPIGEFLAGFIGQVRVAQHAHGIAVNRRRSSRSST